MMMIAHRLGDYRITDNEAGELRWESYAGFGQSMGGRCFIVANVLFLEPSSELNENSYLLSEYHEFLDKLPRWKRTKYFCSRYTIQSCETGRTLGHEMTSRPSRNRKENCSLNITVGNLKPLKRLSPPHDGNTDLKGYFNCF